VNTHKGTRVQKLPDCCFDEPFGSSLDDDDVDEKIKGTVYEHLSESVT